MFRLNPPDTAYATSIESLSGITYSFRWTFNELDSRWRIDIYKDEEPVILGVKVIEGVLLIRHCCDPVDFDHGDLVCLNLQTTDREATRDNIGVGLPYELIYFTNDELNEALEEADPDA